MNTKDCLKLKLTLPPSSNPHFALTATLIAYLIRHTTEEESTFLAARSTCTRHLSQGTAEEKEMTFTGGPEELPRQFIPTVLLQATLVHQYQGAPSTQNTGRA
jgi:hypothetical protein